MSRTSIQGIESEKSLKLKISLIGTSDLIINSWYLLQTIQSIYETVQWIGWKYNYDFVTIYSSLLSSLLSSTTSYNKFKTAPANTTIITEQSSGEEHEQFNSTENSAPIHLTIHDKHNLTWLILDSIFTILTIIILIAATCLILSSIIGQSFPSLKTHLIRFWIFCNYFVALILLSTFLVRLSFTISYLLAPIYLITIFTYLCIRYKWIRIARKYLQNQQDTTHPHHQQENYYAFTLQVPVPPQQQNLHLTTATSSSSSFL